jgi:ABC-type uncharacterized transport system involved in gliding motility auxiliary subunit
LLLVGGPRFEYPQPIVDALKTYVESEAGRSSSWTLRSRPGASPISENAPLVAQLAEWGVAANKDLALDTSGIGQFFGTSEVIPLVTTYESHPIVAPMTDVATGFRCLERWT